MKFAAWSVLPLAVAECAQPAYALMALIFAWRIFINWPWREMPMRTALHHQARRRYS